MPASAERKRNLGRVPGRWWLVSLYLVLLILSAQFPFFSAIERFAPGTPVEVHAFDFVGDKVVKMDRKIPIRAHLHGVDGQKEEEAQVELHPRFRKTVMVYLHRVPWDDQGSQLCEALAKNPEVSVIEAFLPGFHTSSGDVPSHSMESNAEVVAELVEYYGLKEYHVIGQGLGGVAALELARAHPDRVRSLTLVSSPGAQEFEMMGNPLVNKLVYGFHGAFFWGVSRLTPNFGAADLLPWDRDYAKTVFDTDLTDSADILRHWRKPLYLVHGHDDWVTSADAARYSAKLAPHARLDILPGGRDAAFTDVDATAVKLNAFVLGVEHAPPALAPEQTAKNPPVPTAEGARYWMLMVIIFLCCLVAEDPTCLATGLLVGMGIIDFWSGVAACTASIFVGDVALYSLGRFFGRQALHRVPLKWLIKPHQLEQWAGWFSTPRGMFVVVSSRFVPASRVPTFITAGILRLKPLRLGMLLFLAALIWTPVLMYIGQNWGPKILLKLNEYHRIAGWIVVGMLALLYLVTHWFVPALTWRGRRQIVMKVRGFLQPSLWPTAVLYLPIRIGILMLCLRHRHLTAFASANPAFGRIGGFIGDSKSLLLRPFQRDSRCCPTLALSLEDPKDERVKEAAAFAACHGFPVVFKPEVAEDGAGLRFVHTQEQLEKLVLGAKEDFLLQKFISGFEFEVVWRRNPGKDDGRIMAIVQKRDVTVRGDGEQTLEELIWLDEVAVSRGELFIQCHSRDLNRVIPAGQKVTLNLTGSYGHGARCLHRHDLITVGLDTAMTAFAKRFPGLHFARFDLRALSVEDLKAGRFMVTEVGGCCHVSSLLRDESLRFSRSYEVVRGQIQACVEAGAYNLSQKVRPVPLDELMARWSQARGRHDEFAVSEEL
jgi:membrane protein DedA with SNARE-associated domain/pimeloyl-ACP methyl ester carboxylesterase